MSRQTLTITFLYCNIVETQIKDHVCQDDDF